FGAGEAGCFPNLTRAFHTWLPKQERVRAQGIMWLSARWGGAFTPPLVIWIVSYVGWRHAFPIFGAVGLVWAVAFYTWFRDDPTLNPKMNDAERELLRRQAGESVAHVKISWSRLLKSRAVWMLCWQYFSLSYGWYFYITWLPTYLREARHLEVGSTALFSILPLFVGGIGNRASVVVCGWLARRTGDLRRTRRTVASLGFTGAATFLVFSTRVHDPVAA